ncbi:MAG: alpha/beta hydrolase [Tepidisphaeraceae bacterium]
MPVEVEYASLNGRSLTLDVHASTMAGPAPAVVYVHGGGWSGGTKRDEMPLFEALAACGVTVFSVEYRLAPQDPWPACIDDVRSAIAWVAKHASDHNANGSKLGVVGYSAGGQLAAHASFIDAHPAIAAVVLLAAPTDMVLDTLRRGGPSPSLMNLFGKKEIDAELLETLWAVSPINYVRHGLPPVLLLNGTADKSVPHAQSAHLHQRLSDMNVRSDLVSLEGAEHRIRDWKNVDKAWPDRVGRWLRETLAAPVSTKPAE